MPNLPEGFLNFAFNGQHKAMLGTDFDLLMKGSMLTRCSQTAQVIANYKKKPAIYFWVMRCEDKLFRIYIGKTNSMSYRVDNYISEYQPHSPNDFKMRIFYEFMKEAAPGAELDLYFRTKNLEELTKAENQAIKAYTPLLNHRTRASQDAKNFLRAAYIKYYRSSFERMLLDDDQGQA